MMIKRLSSFYSLFSWAWFLIILALFAYTTHAFFIQGRVQFDLVTLLPKSKTENMKAVGQLMEDVNLSGRVLIILGHQDATVSKSALERFRQELQNIYLPLKEQNTQHLTQSYKDFFQKLYPFRVGFLAEGDRNLLLEGKGEELAKRALSEIMLPFSFFGPVKLKNDPFLLYPHFVAALQPVALLQSDENGDFFIKENGKVWYLFQAQLEGTSFSLQTQEEITRKLFPILDRLQQAQGVEVLKTGAIFYAAAGAKQANNEISQIGTFSIVAIILLLLFVFRSFRPLILSVAVISSGLIGGLAVCFFTFNSVHILSLVFGCSLVGVAVDYALHYFCASYRKEKFIDKSQILKSLIPALPLGVLSSSLGYSLLIIMPFPGIQQMAVLASVGLVSSFLSVCLWGPCFIKTSENEIPFIAKKLQIYLDKLTEFGKEKSYRIVLSLFLILLSGAGALFLTFDDNVRSFQSLDVGLKEEENHIKSLIKIDNSSQFLTVKASTLEKVLQIEEKLIPALDKLQLNGEIGSYRSLAAFIPSQNRQRENRELAKKNLYAKYLNMFAQSLGIEEKFDEKAFGFKMPFFVLEKTEIKALPDGWKELLYYPQKDFVMGRILLNGVTNAQSFKDLALQYDGVNYIDPPGEYSNLFSSYRQIIMSLVLGVLLGIIILLSLWEGLKIAFTIILPVAFSLLATIGVIGLFFMPFTLFHAMGLLLVLCIGIDYALFLYWRKPSKSPAKERDLLLLANGLSALTTLLSFGFLTFSRTAAVHNFGFSVFVGIILCFFVTTLFLGGNKT